MRQVVTLQTDPATLEDYLLRDPVSSPPDLLAALHRTLQGRQSTYDVQTLARAGVLIVEQNSDKQKIN